METGEAVRDGRTCLRQRDACLVRVEAGSWGPSGPSGAGLSTEGGLSGAGACLYTGSTATCCRMYTGSGLAWALGTLRNAATDK